MLFSIVISKIVSFPNIGNKYIHLLKTRVQERSLSHSQLVHHSRTVLKMHNY